MCNIMWTLYSSYNILMFHSYCWDLDHRCPAGVQLGFVGVMIEKLKIKIEEMREMKMMGETDTEKSAREGCRDQRNKGSMSYIHRFVIVYCPSLPSLISVR